MYFTNRSGGSMVETGEGYLSLLALVIISTSAARRHDPFYADSVFKTVSNFRLFSFATSFLIRF